MSNWPQLADTSNRFKQTYVKGFVDISGGKLIVRNDDVDFNNRLFIGGDTSLNGNLFVNYDVSFNSRLNVGSDITTQKRLFVIGDTSLNGNLFVIGDTSLNGNLFVIRDTSLNGNLFVIRDTSLNGNLFVNYDVNVNGNLSVGNNISISGRSTATAFDTESDYRIKANVKSLLDTSFTVDLLKPVTYINKKLNKQDIGFIAHEIQENIPFLVNGEKDCSGYQTLNYTGIIGLLTKEIQDLKKQNKAILYRLESAGI